MTHQTMKNVMKTLTRTQAIKGKRKIREIVKMRETHEAKAAKENKLSDEYIEEIKMKKTVYYPFLSEYYKIYAYFWVKSRARKVNDNI